jgi:hypothetical protein
MNTREQVSRWLQELGTMIGTPLVLEDEGVCAISYGEGRLCSIEVPEHEGPIVIHAPLLSLTGLPREEVYARALSLNLFGLGTGGCTIALDEDGDRLILCVSRGAASLDSTSFATLVGAIISTSLQLDAEFEQVGKTSPEGSDAPSDTTPAFGIRV